MYEVEFLSAPSVSLLQAMIKKYEFIISAGKQLTWYFLIHVNQITADNTSGDLNP